MNVIIKNTTSSEVEIEDLGLVLEPLEQVDLVSLFTRYEIMGSTDLETLVQNGTLVVNDGIRDLTVQEALDHLRFVTEHENVFNIDGGRAAENYGSLESLSIDGGDASSF